MAMKHFVFSVIRKTFSIDEQGIEIAHAFGHTDIHTFSTHKKAEEFVLENVAHDEVFSGVGFVKHTLDKDDIWNDSVVLHEWYAQPKYGVKKLRIGYDIIGIEVK